MFVLEKILRGLSDEMGSKLNKNSLYEELLKKLKDLRLKNNSFNEYHEVNKSEESQFLIMFLEV